MNKSIKSVCFFSKKINQSSQSFKQTSNMTEICHRHHPAEYMKRSMIFSKQCRALAATRKEKRTVKRGNRGSRVFEAVSFMLKLKP